MNTPTNEQWKVGLSRLVRRRPFSWLLGLGVRLAVPRQRMGVALVTFNPKEEVLLFRHVFRPANPWGLPGGWLGRNESPDDCLRREIFEEIGLGVELGPVILVSHQSSPSHVIIAYLGRIHPGQMKFSGEVFEARWFPPDQLPSPLWPFTHEAIAAGLDAFRYENRDEIVRLSEEQLPA